MVRLFMICFLFVGSCTYKTEYGRKRMVNASEKYSSIQVPIAIDTACLYEAIGAYSIADLKPLTSFNKTYLKFYANGRVGTFYRFEESDKESLDPKRAEMGYYFMKNNKWFLKTYFEHPQGGGFVQEEIIESNSNGLTLQSANLVSKYNKIEIDPAMLVYSVDW